MRIVGELSRFPSAAAQDRMAEMVSMLAFLPLADIAIAPETVDSQGQSPVQPEDHSMTKFALFVCLEAKPGQEAAVADFLAGALPLANAESGTTAWFALKFGSSTFGVFDAFADEAGREAHLHGPIAAALMANAADLLAEPPQIERADVIGAKLPG